MAFGDYATLRDDFNRPNEVPITTNWTSKILSGNVDVQLFSNQVTSSVGSNAIASAYYDVSTPAADVEAYISVPTLPSAANSNVFRIYARLKDLGGTVADGYFCQVTPQSGANNDQTVLYRLDNGSATSIASVSNFDWVAGDKIGIECIGNSISCYRHDGSSWSLVTSATDSTYPLAGPCGIGMSQTLVRMDDFYMGDIVAAASTWVPRAVVI